MVVAVRAESLPCLFVESFRCLGFRNAGGMCALSAAGVLVLLLSVAGGWGVCMVVWQGPGSSGVLSDCLDLQGPLLLMNLLVDVYCMNCHGRGSVCTLCVLGCNCASGFLSCDVGCVGEACRWGGVELVAQTPSSGICCFIELLSGRWHAPVVGVVSANCGLRCRVCRVCGNFLYDRIGLVSMIVGV